VENIDEKILTNFIMLTHLLTDEEIDGENSMGASMGAHNDSALH